MYAEVSAQVGHLHELAVAVGALVGFLPSVQPHVRLEVVVAGEPLLAHPTPERFLASVGSLVVLQHVLVAKGTVTRPAGEHLVAPCHGVHCTTSALHCF